MAGGQGSSDSKMMGMKGMEGGGRGGGHADGGVRFSLDRLAWPSEVHLSRRPRCDRRARQWRRHPARRREHIRRADPVGPASQRQAVDRGRSERKRDLRRRRADVDSFHPRRSSDHCWRSAARAAVGLPTRRPATPATETCAAASTHAARAAARPCTTTAAGSLQPAADFTSAATPTTPQTNAGPRTLVSATAAAQATATTTTAAQATATTTGRHDSAAGGTRLAAAATAAGSAAASSSTGIGVSVHSTSAQAGRGRRAAHRYHAKTVAAAPPSPAA
jgi:hypothetical protein